MALVASGPTSVAGSSRIADPERAASSSVKPRSNSSATASATMKRLAAMHDWPLLTTRAFTAVSIAAARSALGITMNGSLPPSSSTVFLICRPAAAATLRPACSLPVSVTAGDARIVEDALDLVRAGSAASGTRPRESRRAGRRPRSRARTAARSTRA